MNSIEQNRQKIESALRLLEGSGFDVKQLWRDLTTRTSEYERGEPSEDDRRYKLPLIPPKTEDHFDGSEPQVLSPSVLWVGFSYTLTPGQRAWLRETCSLTPTRTVTIGWVETWPNTQHPRAMLVRSDIHIDPKYRKHILVDVVVREVGKFFRESAERDAENERERHFGITESSLQLGHLFDLESEEKWAIEDITGVRVSARVEVTGVSSDRFVVTCMKTGNVAKVPRKEFFETAREYERLYSETKGKKGRRSQPVPQELMELVKQLEEGTLK